jgi:16S rRNA C967 or C1407 C5-methylase (RsmB/RsmF family)
MKKPITRNRPKPISSFAPATLSDSVEVPVQMPTILKQFDLVWTQLFESPVHLDSVLSKQSARHKTYLARIIPKILLRPASLGEALGIGIHPDEPWNLSAQELARWRPARLMAAQLFEIIRSGSPMPESAPVAADFPPGMVAEWEKSFGKEVTSQLIHSLGSSPPLSLRFRRDTEIPPMVVQIRKWIKAYWGGDGTGLDAEKSPLVPFGIRLSGYAPILKTEWYEKGLFEIQDEGSQWMALFALWPEIFGPRLQEFPGDADSVEAPTAATLSKLNPQGLDIVDACAGAGGKTLALADLLRGKGRIYSYDTSQKKLQGLKRRAIRAGFNNIQTVTVADGEESTQLERFRSSANIVLVDAPCSGWGVLRRNPDIKWRQSSETLSRMPEIQLRLLNEYSKLVSDGGRLIFGVCTFRDAETKKLVQEFQKNHPDFISVAGGYLGPGPCDGFYMHHFRKKGRGE